MKALRQAGADIIELLCLFPTRWPMDRRSQLAGQRGAEGRAVARQTLELARLFRAEDQRTPHRADGLLQPDLYLWRRAFLESRSRPASTALIVWTCRRKWTTNCAFLRLRRASASSAWQRPRRTIAGLPRFSKTRRVSCITVSMTGITGSALPDPSLIAGAVARHQGAYALACLRRLRGEDRRPCARPSAHPQTASSSARRIVNQIASSLTEEGQATEATVPGVEALVRGLAAGVRAHGLPAAE